MNGDTSISCNLSNCDCDKPKAPHPLTREQVLQKLVDKFLAWPLPDSVCSDLCATKQGYPHRSGTTLLAAHEAKQMFEHVLTELFDALSQQAQEVAKYAEESQGYLVKIEHLADQLAAMTAERDAYKAVLQGAEYEQVDRIGALPVEVARQLGEAAAQRTKEIIVDLATLQATLAARERRVALLEEYQKRCEGIEDNLAKSIAENEQLAVDLDTARRDAARLRGILQAILNADERGQGLPFQEAMRVAYQEVKKTT